MKLIKLNWCKYIPAYDLDRELSFLNKNGGIYIWIFGEKTKRITYIGEAKLFGPRFFEHFRNQLGMRYSSCDISPNEDYVEFYATHVSNKSLNELEAPDSKFYYPVGLNSQKTFDAFFRSDWIQKNQAFLKNHKFAFATIETNLTDPKSKTMERKEIEGGLIREISKAYLREYEKNNPDGAKVLICKGGLRPKIFRSNNTLVGSINRYPSCDYEIRHQDLTGNVPKELLSITELHR